MFVRPTSQGQLQQYRYLQPCSSVYAINYYFTLFWFTKTGSVGQHVFFTLFKRSLPPTPITRLCNATRYCKQPWSISGLPPRKFLSPSRHRTMQFSGCSAATGYSLCTCAFPESFVGGQAYWRMRVEAFTPVLRPSLQVAQILFPRSHPDTKEPEKFSLPAFPRKGHQTGEHIARLHPTSWLYTCLLFHFHTVSFIDISHTCYLWKNGTIPIKIFTCSSLLCLWFCIQCYLLNIYLEIVLYMDICKM